PEAHARDAQAGVAEAHVLHRGSLGRDAVGAQSSAAENVLVVADEGERVAVAGGEEANRPVRAEHAASGPKPGKRELDRAWRVMLDEEARQLAGHVRKLGESRDAVAPGRVVPRALGDVIEDERDGWMPLHRLDGGRQL